MKTKGLKSAILFSSVITLTACGGPSIEGSWIEPVPGMPDMMQGFTLKENGEASSVNMATLKYTEWRQEGDRLFLTGKSIGNRQTIEFTDTLIINSLTKDSLVLQREVQNQKGMIYRYGRMDKE